MRELAETLIKGIVDQPDQVVVEPKPGHGENSTILEVTVSDEDVGKVIGKEGRIIDSLRTILKASAAKAGKWVNLEVRGQTKD